MFVVCHNLKLGLVTIWVEFYHNLIFFSFVLFDFFKKFYCYLSFVTTWDIESCYNLRICLLSQFMFFILFYILVFEFYHNLNFWFLSQLHLLISFLQFKFLSFLAIWVWSQLELLSFLVKTIFLWFFSRIFFCEQYFFDGHVFWRKKFFGSIDTLKLTF